MASEETTSNGSTTISSEASLPVDGKGWVDKISQQYDDTLAGLQALASQTTLTPPLQAAMDAIETIKKNVMLHVRISEFAGTASTPSTGSEQSASASPTNILSNGATNN